MNFVPSAVLTRSDKVPINIAKLNLVNTARTTFNTVRRNFNSSKPKTTWNVVIPRNNVFNKAHSQAKRPFHIKTIQKNMVWGQKVNTNHVNTVGSKAVVDTVRENKGNADDPHKALKDKGIVDSGCSKHMTGNKAYLTNYQDFRGGSIAFGGSKGQ
ncbi:hypothetical protein Tco_0076168 [Tanacetum coccineum]